MIPSRKASLKEIAKGAKNLNMEIILIFQKRRLWLDMGHRKVGQGWEDEKVSLYQCPDRF